MMICMSIFFLVLTLALSFITGFIFSSVYETHKVPWKAVLIYWAVVTVYWAANFAARVCGV